METQVDFRSHAVCCRGGTIHLVSGTDLYDRAADTWASQPSWSFNIAHFQKKTNIQYDTNDLITQALSISLVLGHVHGYIISISSYLNVSNQYRSALDEQNMRSSVSLKGVTLTFP